MTPFQQQCYDLLKQIPVGYVTTYGELARAMGTQAYQAIGQVLKRNPNLIEVPCHRVVKSNGEMGGYVKGAEQKQALLVAEGVKIEAGKVVDFKQKLYRFKQKTR